MKKIFIPEQMYHAPIAISLNRLDFEKSLIVYKQKLVSEKKDFEALLKQLMQYCENEITIQGKNCTYFQFDFIDNDELPIDEKIMFNAHVHIDKACFTINVLPYLSKEQVEFKLNKRKIRAEKEYLESKMICETEESKISKI
jgi:hypothetical protein